MTYLDPHAPRGEFPLQTEAEPRVAPFVDIWVFGIAALAGLAGILAGDLGGRPVAEPELATLLRFMAVIKGVMALGSVAAVRWRLRQPAGAGLRWALLASMALMMSAPGVIWGLNQVLAGAVLFHAGFLAFLVTALRDGIWSKPLTRNHRFL
jgi:hypothetical protein